MRYRLLSNILWLYTMLQSEINLVVIVCWMAAFVLMSYKWTYIFPVITLVSLIGMHYVVDTYYYLLLFLAVMSMFMALFTLPHGVPNMSREYPYNDAGYYGGDCDAGGGDCS